MIYRPGLRYEACRECGEIWNVSRLMPRNEVYYCPKCRAKRKKRGAGDGNDNHDRGGAAAGAGHRH